jgi:hypothetical protein
MVGYTLVQIQARRPTKRCRERHPLSSMEHRFITLLGN